MTRPSRGTDICLGLAICSYTCWDSGVHHPGITLAVTQEPLGFSLFAEVGLGWWNSFYHSVFFENLDLNHFRQAALYLCLYVLLWQLDRLILSYKLQFASPVFLFSRLYLCVLLCSLAKFQSTVLFFFLFASACSPGCCENSLPGQARRARRTWNHTFCRKRQGSGQWPIYKLWDWLVFNCLLLSTRHCSGLFSISVLARP